MKKILFIAILSTVIIYGCTSNVEKYIKEKESNITSLEIIEESKEDSAYTPYNTLLSLNYKYSEIGANMENYRYKASLKNSASQAVLYLDSALELYNQETKEISKIFFNCCRYIQLPSICEEPFNRKFVKVEYKLNGELIQQRFFFNNDGKSIGHTDVDIKQLSKEVEAAAFQTLGIKEGIIKDLRSIRGY